ncbi:MAG TPA: C-GCAxxG-C-C family protein [Methanoregulaceae archaeon]|nr:C-GCAxxG-C-C family protein [Methanoregulaceae archaeon]
MNRESSDEAVDLFNRGYFCSQAVLCTYCEQFDLDKDTACRIATPFAAGIGWTGNMCGAVAGALMVIGLKFGNTDPDDMDAKKKVFAATQEFIVEFVDRHGTINCTELPGYDLSDPEQRFEARSKDVTKEKCPVFVRDAADILELILYM